jgi:hypothetical protein
MYLLRFLILSFVSVFFCHKVNAQSIATIDTTKSIKFKFKQIIIPSVLIGIGVVGLESESLKDLNLIIRDEVMEDIDKKLTIDDVMQYSPALSVYALNALNVKGKNNLKNRSIVLATSFLFVAATVRTIKKTSSEQRPDGSDLDSFPSGHTATAFAGVEFMYQEYKDQSIWYGIAGYSVATATGLFRVYNNKHWLTDVAAGAGIGILCTKAAYWLQPFITKHIFTSSKDTKTTSLFSPYYNGHQLGGTYVVRF